MTLMEKIKEKENYYNCLEIDTSLRDFMNEYSIEFSKFKNYDFISRVMYIYVGIFNVTIADAKKDIEYFKPFLDYFNELDSEASLGMLSDCVYVIEKLDKEHQVKELTEEIFMNYYKIYKNNSNFRRVKDFVIDFFKAKFDIDINYILLWLSDIRYAEILAMNVYLNEILSDIKKREEDIKTVKNKKDKVFLENENKNATEKIISGYLKRFTDIIQEINTTITNSRNEVLKIERNRNKKLQGLKFLENDVENNSLKLNTLLKYDLDEDVLNLALLKLLKNKNEDYKKHYQEYLDLKNNQVGKLEEIFHEFNYNFNLLSLDEQSKLSKFPIDIIRENLNFITTSSLNFIEEVDEAFITLITLDSNILMQMDSLIKRDKINREFILKNHQLIKQCSDVLIININKLDYKKVDLLKLIKYNDAILFSLDSQLFDTVNLYDIDMNCENTKYYEFLENSKVLNLIDKYIELGLYNVIRKSPNLINSFSENVLKRIIIMQLLNNNVLNIHGTLNQAVRSGADFYISDADLDDYTKSNFSVFMDSTILDILNANQNVEVIKDIPDEIMFIENYKKSEQIYMIGDKIFSRIKVLRCLNTLIKLGLNNYKELLVQCLIYNYPYDLSYNEILELQSIDKGIMRKKYN